MTEKKNRGPYVRKRQSGKLTAFLSVSAFVLLLSCVYLYITRSAGPPTLAVLDVGQADCIVVRFGGEVAMIDAGDRSKYSEDSIFSYLYANRISKIDYLFATHPHSDHIGGMADVLERIDVETVVFPEIDGKLIPDSAVYTDLLKAAGESGAEIQIAETGDRFTLGGGVFTVISAGGYGDLNSCSIVMIYSCGETDFMLTGDAETAVEQAIIDSEIDIGCEVLKVGHHGSNTSSGSAFLSAVNPDYAVISCKTGNRYGHPHEETLRRIEDGDAEIYRTDKDGTVIFEMSGGVLTVTAEKSQKAA